MQRGSPEKKKRKISFDIHSSFPDIHYVLRIKFLYKGVKFEAVLPSGWMLVVIGAGLG